MLLTRLFCFALLKAYVNMFYSIKIKNNHYLKYHKEPVIIASNHPSLLDTFIYKIALRRIFYVCGARANYFSNPLKRLVMKLGRVQKISTFENFVSETEKILFNNKRDVLMYPEMKRSSTLSEFVEWCAQTSLDLKVNIVPIHIGYKKADKLKSEVRISIGKPIYIKNSRFSVGKLNELLHQKITELGK